VRPAVAEKDRNRRLAAGSGTSPKVHEVGRPAVDLDEELRVGVEPPFLGPPVKAVAPIREEALEVGSIRAEMPAAVVQVLRPAGSGDPIAKVDEDVVADVNRKGLGSEHLRSLAPLVGRRDG